ncbi:protein FAM98B-like isoform X1 [Stegodyphus dumicola]|uniref:protein FAM98B-like isoform X1 n=1 Tax=Stegodyphus dumicola TaxID=202533 RepID=UPI0015B2F44C|nr:protein FAM98B-like isoform X1 [Stegodyphus dumicola]
MDQIISYLSNLGYHGKTEKIVLERAFSEGPPNMAFMDIVIWLSSELASLCELESHVSPVSGNSDEEEVETRAIGFLVEVSSLLKELCCPIKRLTRGSIESRLIESDDKMLVIRMCSFLH